MILRSEPQLLSMHMTRSPTSKCLRLLMAALLFVLAASEASAATGDCKQSGAPAVPSTSTLASLNVPRDLPIGAAIPGSKTAITWSWTCASTGITGGERWVIVADGDWTATAVSGLTNVYQVSSGSATGVSGVGFRFLNSAGVPVPYGPLVYVNAVDMGDAPKGQTNFQWSGYIELVKTSATVSAGTASMWFYTTVRDQIWGNQNKANSKWTYSYTISKPALTTCTVLNSTQNVTLPAVSQAALQNGDSTASTPFNISLQCQAGANLYITMTDAGNPSERYDRLFPAGKPLDVASLIVRTSNGTQVAFGPDSSAAGNVNQWFVGSTPNGVLSIPFTANLAKYPSDTTKPFPIGAYQFKTTFTLSYQ